MHRAEKVRGDLRTEQDLWMELVACILGSRVRHATALAALDRLRAVDLLDLKTLRRRRRTATREIAAALMDLPHPDRPPTSYPFPSVRAAQILGAFEVLYQRGEGLRGLLTRVTSARAIRGLLAERVPGIGPKQASLFLRNIAYSDDLAILDVHVLRYMQGMGLVASAHPPRRLADYEFAEGVLRGHAADAGYPLGCFDLAIWVGMQAVAAPKGYARCA